MAPTKEKRNVRISGRKRLVRAPGFPRPAVKPAVARVPRRFASLDQAGLAYARLLNDPCNADVAAPVYMGTGAGYLTRVTSDLSFATDTGLLVVQPGSWGTSSPNGSCWYATQTSSTIAMTFTNYAGPGSAFFSGLAADVRPVAACITTIYTGSELNRSGVINRAQLNGADGLSFNGQTGDAIASYFPKEDRMPSTELEVKFAPGILDGDFSTSSTAFGAQHRALAVLWRGLGTSSSLKFRVTIVYEWRPVVTEGIIAPRSTGSKSSNTMDDVVGLLSSKSPDWAFTAAKYALPLAANWLLPGTGSLVSKMFS